MCVALCRYLRMHTLLYMKPAFVVSTMTLHVAVLVKAPPPMQHSSNCMNTPTYQNAPLTTTELPANDHVCFDSSSTLPNRMHTTEIWDSNTKI
jgi:hypothetical protein